MSDYEKKFIKRVRKEIAVLGLTMDAVGKAIGSSRQVLSQILNGKFNSMRADTMLKLARLLEISLDEIIFPETNLANKLLVPKFKQIVGETLADMCEGVVLDEDSHAATDMIEWEGKR